MIKPGTPAVCSWSLRPTSPADLAEKVKACGLDAVQLALDPVRTGAWDESDLVRTLNEAGIRLVSGMMATAGEDYTTIESIRRTGGVRPDATWEENLAAARANADLAARLGLPLVTFHAGFIPEDEADPEWAKLLGRVRAVVDVFAAKGVRIGFETGQESAATLLRVLDALDRPGAGVNFDPANMILYGTGDPVAALTDLAPRVVQAHVKDAVRAGQAGVWGEEVPAGTGEVDWDGFFAALARAPGPGLVIEREAGERRVEDVRLAAAMIRERSAGRVGA